MKRLLYIYILSLIAMAAVNTRAQTATPTPSAITSDTQNVTPENIKGVPDIAPKYRSDDRDLPDLGRVGVDMTQQKTLTLREAIELALDNNRDIEISRKTATIAEYDLAAARGFYQPRLSGQTYYDRSTVPNVSIFSSNQKTTQGTLSRSKTDGKEDFEPVLTEPFESTFSGKKECQCVMINPSTPSPALKL